MKDELGWLFNLPTYFKDIKRVREIVEVFFKHGFGQFLDKLEGIEPIREFIRSLRNKNSMPEDSNTTQAVRIRLVFQDLGPTFIKLGQILSTRPDLIPNEFVEELKKLQDNVPPFTFEEAKTQIESELKRPLTEIYEKFGDDVEEGKEKKEIEIKPLGTASIGQVYSARLITGEDVVVKVQRAHVRETIESDIDLLKKLAGFLEKRVRILHNLDLTGIISEFERAVTKELDYTNELRNGMKFSKAFKGNPDVVIPKVYREFSTKKILTMQRIHGEKITCAEKVGSDKVILSQVALKSVFSMVFEQGFFHADPHPGNIFALPNNRIAFLDLGMVGHLDEIMRFKLADLLIGLQERDVESVSRILLSMGVRQGRINHNQFRRDVHEVMDKVTGVPLEDIHFGEIVKDLMEGARRNNIKIPNDYTLMCKALLTVEGVGKDLNPLLDIEAEIVPYIQNLMAIRFSATRIRKSLFNRLVEMYHWSNELPLHVMTILDDLQAGNLKVQLERADQQEMIQNLEKIAGKLTAGLIISSLILSSAMFMTFSKLDYRILGFPLSFGLGGVGFIIAAVLGWRMVGAVFTSFENDRS